MYQFKSRIRYSEVDSKGRATLGSVLDYFQDCSSFQSEELGVGMDFLAEKQAAWVLSSWRIEVKRYPAHGEEAVVSTWPYGFKGFIGYRNFTMESPEGELLAYADSIWVLLDLRRGRPMRLLPEMAEAYRILPRISMEPAPRKLALPKGMESQDAFPVSKYHIDTNQHVNNGKYVSMAQEYLPMGFEVEKMLAEYRKAAVYGDVIYPLVAREGKKITVNLADKEGMPYAIVELEGCG